MISKRSMRTSPRQLKSKRPAAPTKAATNTNALPLQKKKNRNHKISDELSTPSIF